VFRHFSNLICQGDGLIGECSYWLGLGDGLLTKADDWRGQFACFQNRPTGFSRLGTNLQSVCVSLFFHFAGVKISKQGCFVVWVTFLDTKQCASAAQQTCKEPK
jgi:hypothetical protein